MYPQGGGELRKNCVVLLCVCLDVFISSFAKCLDMVR
jgi:hypothetical protein